MKLTKEKLIEMIQEELSGVNEGILDTIKRAFTKGGKKGIRGPRYAGQTDDEEAMAKAKAAALAFAQKHGSLKDFDNEEMSNKLGIDVAVLHQARKAAKEDALRHDSLKGPSDRMKAAIRGDFDPAYDRVGRLLKGYMNSQEELDAFQKAFGVGSPQEWAQKAYEARYGKKGEDLASGHSHNPKNFFGALDSLVKKFPPKDKGAALEIINKMKANYQSTVKESFSLTSEQLRTMAQEELKNLIKEKRK